MLGFRFFKKNKDWKIKKSKKGFFQEYVEPHEILLDSLAEKKEKEITADGGKRKEYGAFPFLLFLRKGSVLEIPLLSRIIQAFFIICFFSLLFLFLKTFQLQVNQGDHFTQLAEKNKFIIEKVQAERGVIYDRNMEQLVSNRLSFNLFCLGNNLPLGEKREKVLEEVSGIVEKNIEEIILNSDSEEILIKDNLSHEELVLLESKIEELSGFEIKSDTVRDYKDGDVFSHLIGYTSKIRKEEFDLDPGSYSFDDYVGREGVESSYEKYLRKNSGKMKIERDALGNFVSTEVVSLPESGKSLVLWLDAELQRKAKEELEKKYIEMEAKGASLVALDPKTGGVLAMVSLPSFDNNLFQKGEDENALAELLKDSGDVNPLLNRSIAGRYLVGSTIKPLIASAALEEKIISPKKQIYSAGYIEIPHRYDPETIYRYKDWMAHGWVDMRKAIAQSSNVYFYAIGGGYQDQEGLGPGGIKKYLELFGWSEKTGIDLPGERNGFIPDPEWKKNYLGEGWWDGDTYNLSIGQGYILVTPLEVATAFSAIANGGTLFQPRIVKEIIGEKTFSSEIIRQEFIDSDNLDIVRQGMRQAVSGENSPQASATILNSLSVKAAAKTGTAELGSDRYNNWVTVIAPYEDPEIVLTIVMENVERVQAAVLPVAKEVLDWYFKEK
jgi:penicillin-binding protein 2